MDELEELSEQIEALKKKAIEVAQKNKKPVIEEMKKKISLYGISANELGFFEKSSSAIKPAVKSTVSPSPVKYKKGDKTWTGRGRNPQFIIEHMDGGGKIEDLLV
jgi:DNA-binding protein H-NS